MPHVRVVIESFVNRGMGVVGDPFRTVTQYHGLDGTLLAEHDSITELQREEPASERCGKKPMDEPFMSPRA